MAANAITFSERVVIDRPKEIVWDYTQNTDLLSEWDKSILEAEVIEESPRTIRLQMTGGITMTIMYTLENRPNKLAFTYRKVESPILEHGGCTSTFEERNGTTLWIQSCTLVFKYHVLLGIMLPIYRLRYGKKMKEAMKRAKSVLESQEYMHPEPEAENNGQDNNEQTADSGTINDPLIQYVQNHKNKAAVPEPE